MPLFGKAYSKKREEVDTLVTQMNLPDFTSYISKVVHKIIMNSLTQYLN